MNQVFSSISSAGLGNSAALAGGTSQALITTAAGLMVVVGMEQESLKLVEVIHARRERIDNVGMETEA